MLPLIHKLVVDDKGWLSEEEAADCIAISQALPGVIATNSATYIGKRLAGFPGALSATLGVVGPSFIIIIAIVGVLDTISGNPVVDGILMGIKAAVAGLILVTAVRMGKKILKSRLHWALAITAFVLIALFDVTAIWAILIGAVSGIVYQLCRHDRGAE